jgi:ArsR family transcriptional regulator
LRTGHDARLTLFGQPVIQIWSGGARVRDVAQLFKVLADESRLKMLWLLCNSRELCVCDLMETLQITQSKASRHLATLRHAGLVSDRKAGAWTYYSLCPVEDARARAQLEALRVSLATHPGAAAVLRALRSWLASKARAACSASEERGDARPRRRASETHAPGARG